MHPSELEARSDFATFEAALTDRPAHVLHQHRHHELFLCVEGRGAQYTPGRRLEMAEGDLFLLPAWQDHYANRTGPVCRGIVVYAFEAFVGSGVAASMARSVLAKLVALAHAGGNLLELSEAGRREAARIVRQLLEETRGAPAALDWGVQLRIGELLLTVLREDHRLGDLRAQAMPQWTRRRLADVYRYLDLHYAEALSVQDLADMVGLSRSHFHTLFRQETGRTLKDYLHELRMQHAQRLLAGTDLPIIDVAYQCGFDNLSHFYHIFRRQVGRTPRQVRAGKVGRVEPAGVESSLGRAGTGRRPGG